MQCIFCRNTAKLDSLYCGRCQADLDEKAITIEEVVEALLSLHDKVHTDTTKRLMEQLRHKLYTV